MRIVLISATDENYAMALGAMIRSVLENLRAGVEVCLYVLGDDLSEDTKRRLMESWRTYPIKVCWLTPRSAKLGEKIQRRGHAGVSATYFRLMIAELLPHDIKRAIYLDVDMIVLGDLSQLWESDFGDAIVQAVPDSYTEYFHRSRLEQARLPVELKLPAGASYFNAGLLVIQVERWRESRVGERALEVASTYGDQLSFHDQDALNLILLGSWKALHPTWNFHELPQFLSAWEAGRYSRAQYRELFLNPKVIHFVSAEKPWTARCYHFCYAPRFFEVLALTRWRDWKPPRLSRAAHFVERVLIQPNIEVNWCLWRGLIHAFCPSILRLLGQRILRSPWVILSYPFWLMWAKKPNVPSPNKSTAP
jgi:lipopolysaccharide biosynthesis glycosyltransferase